MSDHPYGLLSLLPPVTAIALAIVTRRVIWSLLAGVWTGAMILVAYNPPADSQGLWRVVSVPLRGAAAAFQDHLWPTLVMEEKIAVFVFTLLMGALVGIISRSGGMQGLVQVVSRWAHTARRGQLAAWVLGLFVFFDDYANTMLLGSTLRPLSDRLRISREKLAYLVDSTAAPVSGLALISTWVAGEIGYVRDGLEQLPDVSWDAFSLFVSSIPYRFYVLWALLLVPLVALLNRDIGPMAAAERRARRGRPELDEEGTEGGEHAPAEGPPPRWQNAVAPILITVAAIMGFMYHSGRQQLLADGVEPARQTLMNIFGSCDAFMSLVWGSLIGVLSAAAMVRLQGLLSGEQIQAAAGRGARTMVPALSILWLASTMSLMTGNKPPADAAAETAAAETAAADGSADDAPANENGTGENGPPAGGRFPYRAQRLYTGELLGGLLQRRVPVLWLPTLVFTLASAVAFATGTSWGTMGLLMPLTIEASYRILSTAGPPQPQDPVLLSCIGGVLAGAIFGDHCSPISDTTVMSSQSCGCDHMEHVRTQLPYALLVGAAAIVFGTLPVALGVPVWVLLPAGMAALVVALLVLGQPVDEG